jgi:hypothetical protein
LDPDFLPTQNDKKSNVIQKGHKLCAFPLVIPRLDRGTQNLKPRVFPEKLGDEFGNTCCKSSAATKHFSQF